MEWKRQLPTWHLYVETNWRPYECNNTQMMNQQDLMWMFPLLWTSIKWIHINKITLIYTNTHMHTPTHSKEIESMIHWKFEKNIKL
jgi:uncharacterized cysteine cluster protein YcgN (CxxCxxCC family)